MLTDSEITQEILDESDAFWARIDKDNAERPPVKLAAVEPEPLVNRVAEAWERGWRVIEPTAPSWYGESGEGIGCIFYSEVQMSYCGDETATRSLYCSAHKQEK